MIEPWIERLAYSSENIAVILMGLPRSGKTTFSRNFRYPIVCPDSIRLAHHGHRYIQSAEPFIWTVAPLMLKSLFLTGYRRVVVDATNMTPRTRSAWVDPLWDYLFIHIKTDAETCKERAIASDQENLIQVIDSQSERAALDPLLENWEMIPDYNYVVLTNDVDSPNLVQRLNLLLPYCENLREN